MDSWPHRLCELRRRLGLTQTGLGERWGTQKNTIWRWEAGAVPIPGPIRALIECEENKNPAA